ncbi:MAG: hypothetical protein ABI083_07395 [Lapillicoccus sp.]
MAHGGTERFDEETPARAVRVYRDRVEEHGDSEAEARRPVGAVLDINQPVSWRIRRRNLCNIIFTPGWAQQLGP